MLDRPIANIASRQSRLSVVPLLAMCLVCAGALSVWLGQDANWDLKNYHVYNPWAALNNRAPLDLFAAGIQSYLNPTLDLPYYLLAFRWLSDKPKIVAFLAGLPFGALVFLVVHCAVTVLKDFAADSSRLPVTAALLAAFGVSGSATLPQVGTTFNEIQVSLLIVGGVAVILSGVAGQRKLLPISNAIWAGLLFGLAAGLKLTAAIYAPAAVIALFVVAEPRKKAAGTLVVFCFAWSVGFVTAFGWWALQLYQWTGDPMFPMFESFFHSRWLSAGTWVDSQFKAKSLFQAIFYPFFWVHTKSRTVAEPVFSDPRFAVAMIAFGLFGAVALFSRARLPAVGRRKGLEFKIPKTGRFVLLFVLVAYVIWVSTFSILRYAVTIEVLLGLAVGIVGFVCARRLNLTWPASAWDIFFVGLIACVAAATTYPRWGRTEYAETVLRVDALALDRGSLVIAFGSPLAYVLPEIARQNPSVRFVGITDDLLSARKFDLWEKVTGTIANFPGPKYVMVRLDDAAPRFEQLGIIHVAADAAHCQVLATSIDPGFKVCRVRDLPRP
jgi:hypothetical protein